MVLNIEHHIPPLDISMAHQKRSSKISGMIDYAAFTTDPCKHGVCIHSVYMIVLRSSIESFIQSSLFQYVKYQNPNGFFVTEARQEGVPLVEYVPQAVSNMYAFAKYLKYDLVFCPHLLLILSHIHPGKGFSVVLSQMAMNGCF